MATRYRVEVHTLMSYTYPPALPKSGESTRPLPDPAKIQIGNAFVGPDGVIFVRLWATPTALNDGIYRLVPED